MGDALTAIRPIICGWYRMTPGAVGEQTPLELREMLDGIDYCEDRAWERAILPLSKDPGDLIRQRFPRYRVDPVAAAMRTVTKRVPAKAFVGKTPDEISAMLKA